MQILVNGFLQGILFGTVGVAFALVYRTTKVFHVALGGCLAFAPYLASAASGVGAAAWLAAFFAVMTVAVIGILVEEVIHWPLACKRAPPEVHLIASLGAYLVLVQCIALVWGNETRVLKSGVDATLSGGGITLAYAQGLGPILALVATVGPLAGIGDKVTYTYDVNGYVKTITNEVGHLTTVNTVNGRGQPTQITDPNSVVSNLTYDFQGRLLTVTVNPGATQAVTVVNGDGSLRQKSVTLTSANGSKTIQADSNGTGSFDMVETITVSASGTVDTVVYYSPNGILTQRSVTTTSANGLTTTAQVDSTGAGVPCFAATDFRNAVANDNAPWTQCLAAA